MNTPFRISLMLLLAAAGAHAAQSSWVHFDNTHTLVYSNDNLGNRIPDFSFAGYDGGGVALPDVPVKQTISPVGGDNTANIQNAINAVSALTPDTNGFRGAVLLSAGTYPIAGTLTISSGGVVLRGSGNNTNTGTILLVTGNARNVLTVTGSGSWSKTGGTYTITDSYVPLGATNFHISSAPAFSAGSTIIVQRPSMQPWINAIGMSNYWSPGSGLQLERRVTAISGSQITVDAPLCNPIESQWTTGQVYQVTDTRRIQQSGIEDLCAVGQIADYPSNILTGVFANFTNLKNCWASDILLSGWGNGITFGGGTEWCTAQDCQYVNPGTGTSSAAPAAWTIAGGQTLFHRCTSDGGYYHIMVTQASTPGPNVFLNMVCSGTHYNGGPHQRWAAGALHDNIVMGADTGTGYTPYLAINNRGADGSGQGWAAGFSVMYNCQVPQFQLEQPAVTNHYNWTIGGIGSRKSYSDNGIYDSLGTILNPRSLYLEQLKERLGGAAVENIGYALFTISNSPATVTVPQGTNASLAVNIGDPALMSNVVALAVSPDLSARGIGVSLSTNAVTGAGGATLMVTASDSAQSGAYSLNISGTSAGVTHTSAVSLVVFNPAFSITAAPATQTVGAGMSTNFSVSITTNGGFTGSVLFGVAGLPANASAVFAPVSASGSAASTLTVTTTSATPSGSYGLTILGEGADSTNTAAVTLVVVGGTTGAAGTFVWNGPGAGNNNWSTATNWLPAAFPGMSNDVKFFDAGAVSAVSQVNNLVDTDVGVKSLQYGNTNGSHATLVDSGRTLTAGGLTVGTETDNGSGQTVWTAIAGPGGVLSVSNPGGSLVVRQGCGTAGSALKATLDLSGLDVFKAAVSNVAIGSLGGVARPSGTVYLARTNLIIASGPAPAIQIGGQGGGSGNGGNGSFLYLGQTNAIFANGISVATVKQGNCSMLFNPALAGGNPAACFRGADGASRVATWLIADSQSQGGTVNTTGTNDFTGGAVDALVDTMTVGRSSSGSGIGNPSGTLTFDAGTIDVNTLQAGYQSSGGPLTNIASGTVNVNGAAALAVNTGMELGHIPAGGMNATKGTLSINGGVVRAANIFGGGGASTINLNSGTLDSQSGVIRNIVTLNVGANGVTGAAVLRNASILAVSNTIVIASNGVVAGNTVITAPGLIAGGAISPGVSGVGAITNNGTLTLAAGGQFNVAVQDAYGEPAAGWDFLQVSGRLDVQAAANNPFAIRVESLDPNGSDAVTNFNCDTNYDWAIAAANGGITNFSADELTLDVSQFQNDLAGGYFYLRTNGNSLVLSFTNNHPPAAHSVTLYRAGGTMTIPVSGLAGGWSDPDGDPVVLADVQTSSTNGSNNVGSDGIFIYYTNANMAADAIFYTVSDVRTNPPAVYQPDDTQRIAVGEIILLPPPAIGDIAVNASEVVFGGAGGAPGGTYRVLASTNILAPRASWTVMATNQFDAGGRFAFTNGGTPGLPQQFYQLQLP
jgi:hypothetical protein